MLLLSKTVCNVTFVQDPCDDVVVRASASLEGDIDLILSLSHAKDFENDIFRSPTWRSSPKRWKKNRVCSKIDKFACWSPGKALNGITPVVGFINLNEKISLTL